ncbi:hypothetical protein BH11BAC1_BH11BAC1_10370 [soil metagenome]
MRNKILILLVLFHAIVFAQSNTRRVLFLGNSYASVNNLPQIIADVAASAGDTLIFDSHLIGGYSLSQHFDDSISVNKIKAGGWDYVVLQDQSQAPALPDYDGLAAIQLSLLIKQYNPCARPLFYMTWGRKNGDAMNCSAWPPVCTYEGMDSLLYLSYMEMAMTTHSEVSPVGAVWKSMRQNYPAIELYQTDESHPSPEGSYAAACCFYASIFKKDPATITFNFIADTANAAVIRIAARDIVFDSLPGWFFDNDLPAAGFQYTIGTGLNEVRFVNRSLNADTYLWNFGDGNFSSALNPIHNYLSDGSYTVLLTASSCDLSVVHQATYQADFNFCPFSPSVFPDSIILCPNTADTLWTQSFDSWQWFDDNGAAMPNETNQYLAPSFGGAYSVLTTLNGCSEMSPQVTVFAYHPFQSYHVEINGNIIRPDTVCIGDTVLLVLTPNRPPFPEDKNILWLNNGIPITSSGNDTLEIIASGNYQVSYYDSAFCPGNLIFLSPLLPFTFILCNQGISETNNSNQIIVYPNPSENFSIKINPRLLNADYIVTDAIGRTILTGKFDRELNQLKMSDTAPGVYFLQIHNGRDFYLQRLLVQH